MSRRQRSKSCWSDLKDLTMMPVLARVLRSRLSSCPSVFASLVRFAFNSALACFAPFAFICVFACFAFASVFAAAALFAASQAVVDVEDYLVMPITGSTDSKASNELLLSRVNTLREEAGGAGRLFISDLNGPLYILDKASKKLSVYLDFNGNEGRNGIFHKLTITQGYGNGLNGFYLDPDYTHNGRFYTVHIEDPALPGSNLPGNASVPGLNVAGYTTTPAIKTPGPLQNEGVL